MAKYQIVIDWISENISSGELAPGDKIPSENEICEKFGISRQTARHAIGSLVESGILVSIRGSGTYVADERAGKDGKNSIAVITTYVDSYIFPKTIQGIESKLSQLEYTTQISFTGNTVDKERQILEEIINRGDVAGVIIEPTKSALPNPNIRLYKEFAKKDIPVMFINSYYPELDMPHVSLNDKKCAYKAVKKLIDMGHSQIACIMKLDDGQGRGRYAGYIKAIRECGQKVDENNIVWLDSVDARNIKACKDRILGRISGCSAIFAYNDQVASEIIGILEEEGKKVPEDISIMSMDDSDIARLSTPKISSVPHPKEKLGEKAAENLVHMIHHKGFKATYEFEEDLIIRESVKEIKKSN
ncbi:MAG: GntR family transcriptional regulator [Butyrivibrio sp.]|nr:GntR family transcriptional regulator [Butyrivibrio sp.]